MAFKALLRKIRDQHNLPAPYECGYEEDGDEVVVQRLRIPGALGYSKVRIRVNEACISTYGSVIVHT